jgi:hypothetical protein
MPTVKLPIAARPKAVSALRRRLDDLPIPEFFTWAWAGSDTADGEAQP